MTYFYGMGSFWIVINFHGDRYRLKVERLPQEMNRERWKVIAGNKELVISNNRPVLEKRKLKHRISKPDWRIDNGELANLAFRELIYAEIEKRKNSDVSF